LILGMGTVAGASVATATLSTTPASATSGTVRYVSASGNNMLGLNGCANELFPCATVSQAVSVASSGDTIDVFSAASGGTVYDNVVVPGSLSDLTIQALAPGAQTIIDGNSAGPVFTIDSGASVTITGLTIQHGVASSANGLNGGGIQNLGTLTLTADTITDNSAGYGGGGVSTWGTSLTIDNSEITGNTANSLGADSGQGGGGVLEGSGALAASGDTISGNTAVWGGGAYFRAGPASLDDDTISGNTAGSGGGFYQHSAATDMVHVTVANNTANQGGAFWADAVGLQLEATLIGINWEYDTPSHDCAPTVAGAIVDDGYNLNEDGTCDFTQSTSISNVDPKLMPLGNYGGPTQTMPPSPGSPVLDTIPSGGPGCPGSDQRGLTRPQGSGCDIGAVELAVPTASNELYQLPTDPTVPASQGLLVGATDANTQIGATGLTPALVTPPGHGSVTIDPNGSFTYTTSSGVGLDTFTYSLTDSLGFTSAPITVAVCPWYLCITTTSLPSAAAGTAYTTTHLSEVFGDAPLKWTASGLPKGLKLSKAGVLSGKLNKTASAGPYVIHVSVTDSEKPKESASVTLTLTVS
jgi:hypothetical protein